MNSQPEKHVHADLAGGYMRALDEARGFAGIVITTTVLLGYSLAFAIAYLPSGPPLDSTPLATFLIGATK